MLSPSFVAWSLQSDPESVAFWNGWLARNQDCRLRMEQAKLLTIAIREHYHTELPEATLRENMDALLHQVEVPVAWSNRSWQSWLYQHWAVAASLTGLLLLAFGWYLLPAANATVTAQEWIKQTGWKHPLEKSHARPGLSTVILADGSTVILEQGSRLIYPPSFDDSQRKVYLIGEAFFEVTKNAAQPFLVYTSHSVVRVVGTSFRVKATAGQFPDRIAVRTGQVVVYRYQDFQKAGSNERALAEKALVLLPNEQATLDSSRQILQKLPVRNATEVAAIIAPKELVYDDRPVTEVFQQMASLYGVDINYDQKAILRCKITTSFRDESLDERLRNICTAIGAEFRMVDGKISISGKPCR